MFAQWYPEQPLAMAEETALDGDVCLDFHSVSAKQGHFGSSTEYIAAEHRVIHKRWGARRRCFGLLPPKPMKYKPEYLDVPGWITTEEALLDYVVRNRKGWLMGRHKTRNRR